MTMTVVGAAFVVIKSLFMSDGFQEFAATPFCDVPFSVAIQSPKAHPVFHVVLLPPGAFRFSGHPYVSPFSAYLSSYSLDDIQ
jgi:hypothetical protein